MMACMHGLRSSLCAVLSLALSGCYADFPLDATPQVDLDDRLLGTWRCLPADVSADEEAATFVFSVVRDRVYGIQFQEEGKEPELYEAHVSRLKREQFLNVRFLDPSAPKPWAFARYSFLLPHVLHLQYVDEDAFKGVQQTPQAYRRALEKLPRDSPFYVEYAVCARAKAEHQAQK